MGSRWTAAALLNRAGWCWSDLVDWALRPSTRPLRRVDRQSTCARERDTVRAGGCYCGQVGLQSPGERRRERRARRAPFLSAAAVVAVVFGVLAAAAAVGPSAEGPAERVPYDVGATIPPPSGPGAELVRGQLVDAQDGVVP